MASLSKRNWEKKTLQPLKQRFGERQDDFQTESGLGVETLYTPEEQDGFDYDEKLGYPGDYPYTRGVGSSAIHTQVAEAVERFDKAGERGDRRPARVGPQLSLEADDG
jgi:methylmalonyl-CoA mutase N-terminal domain/subunit